MFGNRNKWKQRQGRFGSFSETLPLNPDDVLFLKCSGPININGDDRGDVLFKGVGDLHWSREGQLIKVHIDGPISATVPRNAHLQLSTDGPIKVRKVTEGELVVVSMDGPLTIEGGASLRVNDADGPLTAIRISGAVTVDDMDGPITLKDIGGDVTIDDADGPVIIKHCGGNIDVTTDCDAYLTLMGDVSQNVRLRADGNVFLRTPASAQVTGTIQANGRIIVDLDGQTIEAENETITLPQIEGAPIITVDLKVDGGVYIGPTPPEPTAVSGLHQIGLAGWIPGRFFGRRRGGRRWRVRTPMPDEAAPIAEEAMPPEEPENFSAEREMILRMVEEGKITAKEGEQLLEALQ